MPVNCHDCHEELRYSEIIVWSKDVVCCKSCWRKRIANAIPSLDEVIERLQRDVRGKDAMREVARRVASGERNTKNLPKNVVVFAMQCFVALFDHANTTGQRQSSVDTNEVDTEP